MPRVYQVSLRRSTLTLAVIICVALSWAMRDGYGAEPGISRSNTVELKYFGSTLWTGMTDVCVRGDLAYFALPAGIRVVDISNPTDLKVVNDYYVPGYVLSVAAGNDFLFAGTRDSGLLVLDASDSEKVRRVGGYRGKKCWARDIAVYEDLLFLCCGTGVMILDATNPRSPGFLSFFPIPGDSGFIPRGISVVDSIAYVAAGHTWVLNVTDPLWNVSIEMRQVVS